MKIETEGTSWVCEDGCFELAINGKWVLAAAAEAVHTDGRRISTENADFVGGRILDGDELLETAFSKTCEKVMELEFHHKNGLLLKEYLGIEQDGTPWAFCRLQDNRGIPVTRELSPLIMQESQRSMTDLWNSLWSKMLLIPYDNTMWSRYEAVPLRPGRESYDLTVLFSDSDGEGILVGAIDFDKWKNAVYCSGCDARKLIAVSGVADKGTHDVQLHGCLIDESVDSSRFVIMYGKDYRKLMEKYGDLLKEKEQPMQWSLGVPFGWNSWSALGFRLNEENFRETGEFMRRQMNSGKYQNGDTMYLNLDAGWNGIPEERIKNLVDDIHRKGMKVGIYDVPFAYFGSDVTESIPQMEDVVFRDILLKDENENVLPRVDGAVAMDVTHPHWKEYTQKKYKKMMEWGFDYIKLDFLSHGGMEGEHWNKKIRTGRQAITTGYHFIREQIDTYANGRPVFISLSIAPLFPCGNGHARRFSCDSFGTAEDIEYVLNAQTYAWWQSGRLYAYNDPDHISMLRSFCGKRDTSEGEAKARYSSAVIAGTVMMVSDDYEKEEARKRMILYSSNEQINQIARSGVAFQPEESAGTSASRVYSAIIDNKKYLALFHWSNTAEFMSVSTRECGLPEHLICRELWTGKTLEMTGEIQWWFDGCDAAILEIE